MSDRVHLRRRAAGARSATCWATASTPGRAYRSRDRTDACRERASTADPLSGLSGALGHHASVGPEATRNWGLETRTHPVRTTAGHRPRGAYWRRGIEAATRWRRETGNTELRVPYTYVRPEDRPAIGGHPLGVWIADQRRYFAAGTLEPERVAELEALGMVWSQQDTAWAEGLDVARDYAAAHGHFLPPTTAVWGDGSPIGVKST